MTLHRSNDLLRGLVAVAVLGASSPAVAGEDASLRADLEILARRSVYFGHQSVGANVVEGVRDLAAQAGVPLRVVEVGDASAVGAGTFGHGPVAENGNPLLKLRSFENALGAAPSRVEIALVKFCFVDVVAGTDPRALFARYEETMRMLRSRHPRTVFVHVTVPLTRVQSGWKALVKSLLGRAPYGFEEDVRREEFNALLRQAYDGREPVFDLARIEATSPDGRLETAEVRGRRVPTLVASYTDDGGHLNAEGRRRVARRLVALLASLPRRAGTAAAEGK